MTSVIWKIAGAAWGSTALTAALMQARWYVLVALTVAAAVLAAACVAIWFWAYPRVTMHRTVSDTKAAIARRRLWADSGFEPDDDLGRYAGGGAAATTSPRSEFAAPLLRPPAARRAADLPRGARPRRGRCAPRRPRR